MTLLFGLPRGLPRNTATLDQRIAVARRRGACSERAYRSPSSGQSAATRLPYLSVPLQALGFGPSEISLALLIFGSAAAIGNMLGGTLADRIGPIPTATLGLTT